MISMSPEELVRRQADSDRLEAVQKLAKMEDQKRGLRLAINVLIKEEKNLDILIDTYKKKIKLHAIIPL